MVHPDPVPRDPKRRDLSRTLPAEPTPSSSPSTAAHRVLPMGRSRRPRQDPSPASSTDAPQDPRSGSETEGARADPNTPRVVPDGDDRESPPAARRRSWKEQRAPDPTWFIPPGPADREIHSRQAPEAVRPEVPCRDAERRHPEGEETQGSWTDPTPKGRRTTREPDPRTNTLESNHPPLARAGDVVNGRRAGVREIRGGESPPADRLRAWRGFEGWRVAEGPRTPLVSTNGAKGRNAANPRIGCGVQQTRRTHDGGNRQGGGKPRRRNRTCAVASAGRSEAEPRREPRRTRAGVDVERPDRWRGNLWKPHEKRLERSRQGRKERVSRRRLPVVGGAASAAPPGARSFSLPPKKARKDDGEAKPPYPAPQRPGTSVRGTGPSPDPHLSSVF
jgi:hypothetical protein